MIVVNTPTIKSEYTEMQLITEIVSEMGLVPYTDVGSNLARIQNEAIKRIIYRAERMKADGIINIKIATTINATSLVVSIAGTTIKLKNKEQTEKS